MSTVVFLTGATGFVGGQTARRLMAREDLRMVVLVRGKDRQEAEARLSRTWWSWPELAGQIGRRIDVLAGDVTSPRLGLGPEEYQGLAARITHIIHSAADLRLDGPIDELRTINVRGTAEVLELARAAHRHHGLTRFAHVSTAYVAGKRTGPVPEEALSDEHGFSNSYEQTKFEGERLVRAAGGELPLTVFRPGMIVGDSQTGEIATFNTVYVPLRLYLTGKLKVMPCKGDLAVNVVPVDYVADAIARLTFDGRAEGKTFHLTVPPRLLPSARQLLEGVKEWAEKALDVRRALPVMIPISAGALDGKLLRRIPSALISYFSEDRQFETANTEGLLGPCTMDWRAVLPRLLAYAAAKGFLHASGRTAPEQVLFRLQSKTRPVRFHEIAGGAVRERSAGEVREQILQSAGGLRSMGVAPGDRVAIVGLNGVRCLILDVAMGLVGAVSVPLYYTTPAAEMDDILRASGSRLLFIGAAGPFQELAKMTTRIPVVSFCKAPIPPGEAFPPVPVLPWEEFLAMGAPDVGTEPALGAHTAWGVGAALSMPQRTAPHEAGASRRTAVPPSALALSDDATLRFTSGTTGRPKGAIFRHDQVRWMAETLASLLPWKARITHASYLSFLPMSHVVEGILGTYAPYYLPARVDIWFLEDFRALARALPRVRPTVFFSVPRFYEKVWESFTSGPAGRLYQRAPDGMLKNIMRPVLRAALLRKSGLNKCAQLISGSAPASSTLLTAFQEMGIVIHNAYGLTEAPLVTLNIAGSNRPGTVGIPLPETRISIAEDGEVLVKGPQVMRGYDGAVEQPFRDGWLLTGDLGHLNNDGSLVLDGRKKDLIVTSYGKNIHPGKIEAMIKGIPGVIEAMVIGEGRPFCAALLWVKDSFVGNARIESLDREVREMNGRLSHPERIKKWTVLHNDLSIEGGELTGNLKLKRDAISRRFASQIESMFNGGLPGMALHSGAAEKEPA